MYKYTFARNGNIIKIKAPTETSSRVYKDIYEGLVCWPGVFDTKAAATAFKKVLTDKEKYDPTPFTLRDWQTRQ